MTPQEFPGFSNGLRLAPNKQRQQIPDGQN
jgi:hypothetical protein